MAERLENELFMCAFILLFVVALMLLYSETMSVDFRPSILELTQTRNYSNECCAGFGCKLG